MRHDVDQSLEAAQRLAQVEAAMGVRATYFLWVTSPFYNCFDPTQRNLIRSLLSAGHEIGLHFDASAYPGSVDDLLEHAVAAECEVLERVVDRSVRVVSFHRPVAELLNRDFRMSGYTSAYGPRFSTEFRYLSDSGRNWREGCVCDKLQRDIAPPRLHLLTHAFWWTGVADTLVGRLRDFLGEKSAYIDSALERNIKGYTRRF
jgi:hypothetical protein